MTHTARIALLLACTSSVLALIGCTLTPTAVPTPQTGADIRGVIHGGTQPIVGAHIYLFAANTNGYAGIGIAASSTNASISLLNTADAGVYSDSVGAYVLSDSNGDFTITGDYTCTPNSQVYIYALGGNPGAGVNIASGLMAVLGNCPSSGNFLAEIPLLVINEVTTVVAAYTMAPFATDATHVADDEAVVGNTTATLAKTGMANAFATAANIESLSQGATYATTAGGGTVPQATIDTIANILASCVNSTGPASSGCPVLLADATNNGTQPTDTATAAINIAHYPGTNVTALYNLQGSSPPFGSPALSSAPNDFIVGVTYPLAGENGAEGVAIDSAGNVWMPNFYGQSVTKLSPLGAAISPSGGYTGGGLNGPNSIAIDPSGNVWMTNGNGDSVSEFNNSGSALSTSAGYPAGGLFTPEQIAIDAAGTAWLTVSSNPGYVTHLSASGTNIATYNGAGYPNGIAIDTSGNVWFDGAYGDTKLTSPSFGATTEYAEGGQNLAIDSSGDIWSNIGELSSSGTHIANFPSSSSNSRYSLTLDGAGNVWMTNQDSTNSVQEFSSTFVKLSPTNDYCYNTSLLYSTARPNIAVDGSGNVWITGQGQSWATELIGAATPVVTPISLGVTYKKLATRP